MPAILRTQSNDNTGESMKIEPARGVPRLLWVLAVVALGCGDPESSDHRGYTKAPLEHAGVIIRGENPSAMDALGTPNLPVARVITPEEAATPARK
jgi:hypothetical protein